MEFDEGYTGRFGPGFESRQIRKKFVCKVYALFSLQVGLMTSTVFICLFVDAIRRFFVRDFIVCIMAFIVFIVSYYVILCYHSLRTKVPLNYILLTIVTSSLSLAMGALAARYTKYAVLAALGMTFAIAIVITIIASLPCIDVTGWGIYLCLASMMLVLFGTVIMILGFFTNIRILNMIYSAIAVILFSFYLLFDTQLILGGRKHEISPEEYILACVSLFIDFVYIFMNLLQLTSSA